ncbi:Phosphoribosylglycinamide formyltransferase (GART), partial [Pleodorina starrii]
MLQIGAGDMHMRSWTTAHRTAGFSSRAPTTACFASACRPMPSPLSAAPAAQPARPDAPTSSQPHPFTPFSPHSPSSPLHRSRRVVAAAHGALPEYTLAPKPPARLAVFVSGGGSNFKAIHAACLDGRINGTVVAVVSDVPTCGGVSYAREHGIPTLTYPVVKKGEHAGSGLTPTQLVDTLKSGPSAADFVLLAGYLKLIPPELCRAFPRAMLNIHPGLLPSFGGKGYYGERVHKAVIASGARFSGPTVHFVDEEFDTGPILAQRVVPVFPTDSPKQLAARVLREEHVVYPHCVAALCDGRIGWREDGVPILWE